MTPNKQYMDRISRLRREQFPVTSLPSWLDEAIPVIGFAVCFGMAVLFVALGWA